MTSRERSRDRRFRQARRRFLLQSAALGLAGTGLGLPRLGLAASTDVTPASIMIALGGRLVGEGVVQTTGGDSFLEAVPVSSTAPSGLALRRRQLAMTYLPGGMHGTFNEFVAAAIGPRDAPPADVTVMVNDTFGQERYRLTLPGARPVALAYSHRTNELQLPRWDLTLAAATGSQVTVASPVARQVLALNRDLSAARPQVFIQGLDDLNPAITRLSWSATLMPTPMDPQTLSRWAIKLAFTIGLARASKLTQWLDIALRGQLDERPAVLRLVRNDGSIATELTMERVGVLSAALLDARIDASDALDARVDASDAVLAYNVELYARTVKLKFTSATSA